MAYALLALYRKGLVTRQRLTRERLGRQAWLYRPCLPLAVHLATLVADLLNGARVAELLIAVRLSLNEKECRCAVRDRNCEMERPWDWISKDPDLHCLGA